MSGKPAAMFLVFTMLKNDKASWCRLTCADVCRPQNVRLASPFGGACTTPCSIWWRDVIPWSNDQQHVGLFVSLHVIFVVIFPFFWSLTVLTIHEVSAGVVNQATSSASPLRRRLIQCAHFKLVFTMTSWSMGDLSSCREHLKKMWVSKWNMHAYIHSTHKRVCTIGGRCGLRSTRTN